MVERVPGLLLILAAIYVVMGLLGALMICQPPEDWTRRNDSPKHANLDDLELIEPDKVNEKMAIGEEKELGEADDDELNIHWKDALRMKEFYILWITRLSVVLITQVRYCTRN